MGGINDRVGAPVGLRASLALGEQLDCKFRAHRPVDVPMGGDFCSRLRILGAAVLPMEDRQPTALPGCEFGACMHLTSFTLTSRCSEFLDRYLPNRFWFPLLSIVSKVDFDVQR